MSLTARQGVLSRASFAVAQGRAFRTLSRSFARNIADAAHSDCGEIISVYRDDLGYFVTAHTVTRTDVSLVYSVGEES